MHSAILDRDRNINQALAGMEKQADTGGSCQHPRAQTQPALQDAAQHIASPPWQEQATGPLPSTCLQAAASELCGLPLAGLQLPKVERPQSPAEVALLMTLTSGEKLRRSTEEGQAELLGGL